jgi:hypothetical protein
MSKFNAVAEARAVATIAQQDYDSAVRRSVRARTALEAAVNEYAEACRDLGQTSMTLIAAENRLAAIKPHALCRTSDCWDLPLAGGMGYCGAHLPSD